jgi:hypothetical protein
MSAAQTTNISRNVREPTTAMSITYWRKKSTMPSRRLVGGEGPPRGVGWGPTDVGLRAGVCGGGRLGEEADEPSASPLPPMSSRKAAGRDTEWVAVGAGLRSSRRERKRLGTMLPPGPVGK